MFLTFSTKLFLHCNHMKHGVRMPRHALVSSHAQCSYLMAVQHLFWAAELSKRQGCESKSFLALIPKHLVILHQVLIWPTLI